MKNAVVVVAMSGIASGALAQSLEINIHLSDTLVPHVGTVTASMTATFTGPGTPYLSVVDFNLQAYTNPGHFEFFDLTLGGWNMDALGPATGTIEADGIRDIHLSQQALFGAVDTTSNSLLIATWKIRNIGGAGRSHYRATATDAPFSFGVNDADDSFGAPIVFGPEAVQELVLVTIPTPHTLGLLFLGGSLGVRRRRKFD
jgi:hypothetical protein